MTNEEAILHMTLRREELKLSVGDLDEDIEAFDMVIKALEQESCEDAISRQAAIRIAEQGQIQGFEWQFKQLVDLPSVSTKKTGHWIMPVQDDGMSDPIYYQVRCSECGFDLDPQTWHQELHQYGADKYCPKCGCRIMEVEE